MFEWFKKKPPSPVAQMVQDANEEIWSTYFPNGQKELEDLAQRVVYALAGKIGFDEAVSIIFRLYTAEHLYMKRTASTFDPMKSLSRHHTSQPLTPEEVKRIFAIILPKGAQTGASEVEAIPVFGRTVEAGTAQQFLIVTRRVGIEALQDADIGIETISDPQRTLNKWTIAKGTESAVIFFDITDLVHKPPK